MMGRLAASWNWLKIAWATQPVLVVAVVMSAGGPLWVLLRPGSKVLQKEIETWPTHYRKRKDVNPMDDY